MTGAVYILDGFDAGVLAGLADVLGDARMLRLLRIGRDEFTDALIRIRSAVTAGDVPLALSEAHATRGAAGNIGAALVVAAIESLEGALKAMADPAPSLAAIDATIAAACAAIDAHVATRGGP